MIPVRIRKVKEMCKCYRLFMWYLVKAFQCRIALELPILVSSSYCFALFGIDL